MYSVHTEKHKSHRLINSEQREYDKLTMYNGVPHNVLAIIPSSKNRAKPKSAKIINVSSNNILNGIENQLRIYCMNNSMANNNL